MPSFTPQAYFITRSPNSLPPTNLGSHALDNGRHTLPVRLGLSSRDRHLLEQRLRGSGRRLQLDRLGGQLVLQPGHIRPRLCHLLQAPAQRVDVILNVRQFSDKVCRVCVSQKVVAQD